MASHTYKPAANRAAQARFADSTARLPNVSKHCEAEILACMAQYGIGKRAAIELLISKGAQIR